MHEERESPKLWGTGTPWGLPRKLGAPTREAERVGGARS